MWNLRLSMLTSLSSIYYSIGIFVCPNKTAIQCVAEWLKPYGRHYIMGNSRQVKCINKANRTSPHERIQNIGGDWGKTSVTQAIKDLEGTEIDYYVNVNGSNAKVIIALHSGNKYLKTTADTTTVDNLLSLPECR